MRKSVFVFSIGFVFMVVLSFFTMAEIPAGLPPPPPMDSGITNFSGSNPLPPPPALDTNISSQLPPPPNLSLMAFPNEINGNTVKSSYSNILTLIIGIVLVILIVAGYFVVKKRSSDISKRVLVKDSM